jgi:hypothetical protein
MEKRATFFAAAAIEMRSAEHARVIASRMGGSIRWAA